VRRSPGADPEIYFPSDQHERRLTSLHGEINDMIYGSHEAPNAKCTLKARAAALSTQPLRRMLPKHDAYGARRRLNASHQKQQDLKLLIEEIPSSREG